MNQFSEKELFFWNLFWKSRNLSKRNRCGFGIPIEPWVMYSSRFMRYWNVTCSRLCIAGQTEWDNYNKERAGATKWSRRITPQLSGAIWANISCWRRKETTIESPTCKAFHVCLLVCIQRMTINFSFTFCYDLLPFAVKWWTTSDLREAWKSTVPPITKSGIGQNKYDTFEMKTWRRWSPGNWTLRPFVNTIVYRYHPSKESRFPTPVGALPDVTEHAGLNA